jgi:glycosyltransferase 2 family protein
MLRVLRIFGLIVCVLATGYFAYFAYRTIADHDLTAYRDPVMIAAMLGAALAYFSIIPVTSWAWHRLLSSLQYRTSLLALNAIMGITQIAKYVQHLGRSAFSLKRGMPTQTLFVSLTTELLLAAAAAGIVGALALVTFLLSQGSALRDHMVFFGLAGTLSVASIAGLGLTIRFAPRIASRLFPGKIIDALVTPTPSAMFRAFLAYCFNYVVIGAALYSIARAAGQADLSWIPLFIGVFSLSWLAGFVAPGAPAGLGVREGTMAAMLNPFLDQGVALVTIIAFRIASTLGDLISLLWGSAAYIRERNLRPAICD